MKKEETIKFSEMKMEVVLLLIYQFNQIIHSIHSISPLGIFCTLCDNIPIPVNDETIFGGEAGEKRNGNNNNSNNNNRDIIKYTFNLFANWFCPLEYSYLARKSSSMFSRLCCSIQMQEQRQQ